MTITQRIIFAGAIGLAAAAGPAYADEPIRIGLVLPFSAGPYVPIANEIADSLAMAIADSGGEVGGRKIEILKEDTTHKPDVAQAKAKKLVFEDKADVLVGPVASAELTALFDFANQSKTPLIIPNAGDNEATGEHCSPWVVRTSFSNDQIVRDMGPWMIKHGYKKVSLIAFDYAAGHQLMDGFKKGFTAAGGTITNEQYPPFGPISDFGPYLGKIKDAKPDAVFTFFAGPPATALVKQFSQFGLKDSIKLSGPGRLISPLNLAGEGDAAVGVLGVLNYVPAIDTPENKAFQKEFQDKFHRVASEFAAQGYDTGKLIFAALKAVDGKTADKAALVKAMHGVTVKGTRGELRIDPKTNNVIQNIYIYEAKKADDKVDFAVLDKIPAVQDPPNGCKL
ncbi:MAG TPA: ABC transporter substrate-binding protein [Stellaceae bacterium]|nr:ABC transporter substrate-binding protein [Stellaceae bacterium]